MMTERKLATLLRREGYKVTPQRRAILKIVTETHDHLTPAALYERVQKAQPHIGLVTIYRTIQILEQLGLICEMHAERTSRSYLLKRASEHHHHIVCSGCGTVTDVTHCELEKLQEQLAKETGFEIDGHILEFFGYCRQCQRLKAE
ncbi:MAG TPA: transcriptional repressor [Dehalococcoidia bacterium]|nr:transcriptional repressor [Dehalococcoidia bacterium]